MSSKNSYNDGWHRALRVTMHLLAGVAFQLGVALFALLFIVLGHELVFELTKPREHWVAEDILYDIVLLWIFGFVIDICTKILFGKTIIHTVEEKFRLLLK